MNRFLKTTSICGPALLLAAAAQAQFVVPGRIAPLPVPVVPVIRLPAGPSIAPLLPRPDVPVLPVPQLPGSPMYRLQMPAPAVPAQAVAASAEAAVVAPEAVSLPGPVAALPMALASKVTERKASEVRPGAPTRTIERARRGFGLSGKRPDERKLASMFDGIRTDSEGNIVIVDEVEQTQTLPENDLLREIGVVAPRD